MDERPRECLLPSRKAGILFGGQSHHPPQHGELSQVLELSRLRPFTPAGGLSALLLEADERGRLSQCLLSAISGHGALGHFSC